MAKESKTSQAKSKPTLALNEVCGVVLNVLAAGRIQIIADDLKQYPDELIFMTSPGVYTQILEYFKDKDRGYRKVRLQVENFDPMMQLAGIVIATESLHVSPAIQEIVTQAMA